MESSIHVRKIVEDFFGSIRAVASLAAESGETPDVLVFGRRFELLLRHCGLVPLESAARAYWGSFGGIEIYTETEDE